MNTLLADRWRSDPRIAWAGYVALGITLAVLPFVVDAGMGRTWVRILDFALLYVMLALGLNIVVGFAPLKPAEFVIIKIQQIAGQIET